MPPSFAVDLVPHDPLWARAATQVAGDLHRALGPALLTVHHIGSTAIAGIAAKPILDLLPVAASLPALDAGRERLEGLGYVWWGPLGLPGRRYCTRDDPATGQRSIQLHAYAAGSPDIERHLAFRDLLRERLDLAIAYDREKRRCRALFPMDSHAYGACKSAWIEAVEAEALATRRP